MDYVHTSRNERHQDMVWTVERAMRTQLGIHTHALVTPPLLVLSALGINELMRRVLMAPANARSAVFVGCNNASLALAERLGRNSELCIRVEGFFDDRNPRTAFLPSSMTWPISSRTRATSGFAFESGVK